MDIVRNFYQFVQRIFATFLEEEAPTITTVTTTTARITTQDSTTIVTTTTTTVVQRRNMDHETFQTIWPYLEDKYVLVETPIEGKYYL